MKKIPKKLSRNRSIVTINLTCPVRLYERGKLAWEDKGYKGPADVFQTALRKMADMEMPAL